MVNNAEERKLKNLQKLTVDGKNGTKAVLPVGSELFGGLGKSASKFLTMLSEVAIPGDDEDLTVRRGAPLLGVTRA